MVRLLFGAGLALAIMIAAKPAIAADAKPETYSWTGPYVGLNLGGAKGESRVKDLSPPPGFNNLVGKPGHLVIMRLRAALKPATTCKQASSFSAASWISGI
jgi:hypothetical protein